MKGIGGRYARVLLFALLGAVGCSFNGGGIGGGAPGSDPGSSPDAGPAGPDSETDAASPSEPDADPGPMPGVIESPSVPQPPELDGDKSDWAGAAFKTFAIEDAAKLFMVDDDYGYDAEVSFASVHDDSAIYFFFDVVDDTLVDDSSASYMDDSIELYLDAAGDMSGPYGDDDHWIVIESSNVYESLGPANIEITGTVTPTADGYHVEIGLPRSDMNESSASGVFGFNVGIVDDDGHGAPSADAYGLWYAPEVDHCTDCCSEDSGPQAWCDTTLFGRLLLVP